jgi:NADH-quinone oxidoreductase subunit J
MEAAVFFVFAALVLVGAFGVILARNPVHSALYLLMTMCSVAVLFLQLEAALVAGIQIIVYASAIVVLFLFVITLLGVDQHESLVETKPFQRPAAIVLGALMIAGILLLVGGNNWVTGARIPAGDTYSLDPARTGNVENLAETLFTDFVWAFEMTAVLLVIAVVGGVVLARRSSQRHQAPTPAGETVG